MLILKTSGLRLDEFKIGELKQGKFLRFLQLLDVLCF